ncbi:hypothetical protein [Pseudomonas fluorescens]|uniref:Uncharacterized protein n=1 Tax=Pseudomonas fluorescens TaxID=294 RepID=A0A5E7EAP5_PSEFL|nr:hypothetical protein [Pseudomonas fluorescens]VVO23950.1 hypothetical protein PS710_04468 [Pseudomonas fluorescens]
MLAYPEGLPLPLREGYGFDPVSPMTSSALVTGRKIRRRAYRSVPTVAAVSWLMSDTQAQLFEGWFEHVLISGTAPFECQFKTPTGLDDYQARFTDIYSGPTLVGVSHWRFTANLELLKRPLVDAEWVLFAPEYILMSDIFDSAMTQEWPRDVDE